MATPIKLKPPIRAIKKETKASVGRPVGYKSPSRKLNTFSDISITVSHRKNVLPNGVLDQILSDAQKVLIIKKFRELFEVNVDTLAEEVFIKIPECTKLNILAFAVSLSVGSLSAENRNLLLKTLKAKYKDTHSFSFGYAKNNKLVVEVTTK